ncbi:MAG: hypothetical protein JRH10_21900 [Deltaproteobacteria bacterium]|nr:hypothetical protein [Deltaproteobacteria bacterium]
MKGAFKDWQSNSHIINLSYDDVPYVKPVAFVYLLDLDNRSNPASARAFASASYGLRLTGGLDLGEQWKLTYGGSYAFQTDYGKNPVDYQAHYTKLDLGLGHSSLGSVAAGWEMLGSDGGKARFVTPLATLHKFNGWADVFLGNGGTSGLRDFYAVVSPKLPWELKTQLVYHHFTSDNKATALGNEFDGSLGRSFGKYLSLLFKAAYFNPSDGSPRPNVYRIWFDVTVKI